MLYQCLILFFLMHFFKKFEMYLDLPRLLSLMSPLRTVTIKLFGTVCVLVVPSAESQGAVYCQLHFVMNGNASG